MTDREPVSETGIDGDWGSQTLLFVKRAMARDETKKRILSRVPMGRPGGPEEVAPTIVHLASEYASSTTGCAFFVDGGTDAN